MCGLVKSGMGLLLSGIIISNMASPIYIPSTEIENETPRVEIVEIVPDAPPVEEPTIEFDTDVEETIEVETTDEPESETVEYPKLYTDKDVEVLAKMLWGEARGVKDFEVDGHTVSGTCQKAAVIWTALNRYDAGYEDSIAEVVTAKYQFTGYRKSNPVDEDILEVVYDVLDRWNAEQYGETEVGRVLPSDHHWFLGDGEHNHFRNVYESTDTYTWDLPDVYAP